MRDFVYGNTFGTFIIIVIVLNALIIGAETYVQHPLLRTLDKICVGIFILEIALKMLYAPRLRDYFRDGWNWFDIIIVGAALVPGNGNTSTVLRILRVFRVLRLVNALPELKLIVNVLWRSVASMAYISILMIIAFYIYGVIAVKLFGDTQPEHYGTLHEALFSLFRSLTAEDWTDLRYEGIAAGSDYWVVTTFHVTWILLATFVMINLVVGAILNNYHEVQEIERRRKQKLDVSDARLRELVAEIHEILERRALGEAVDAAK